MDIDLKQIRSLADLAIKKGLAEITVQEGDKSITVKLPLGNSAGGSAAQPVMTTASAAEVPVALPVAESAPAKGGKKAASAADDSKHHKITSPMVGTFYNAPSPDSPAFVKVGDKISKGQTLCIIEAMKMMNELESDIAGTVVKILVDDAQPVEFGQTIMLVDPS